MTALITYSRPFLLILLLNIGSTLTKVNTEQALRDKFSQQQLNSRVEEFLDDTTILRRYKELNQGREPSARFWEWVRYAEDNGCLTDPYHYRQIFEDLGTFRDKQTSQSLLTQQMFDEGEKFYGVYKFIINVNGTKKTNFENVVPEMIEPYLYENVFENFAHFLRPNIVVLFNVLDENRVLLPDGPWINDHKEIPKKNRCIKETYFNSRNSAKGIPYFYSPVRNDSWTQTLIPIFSVSKLKCFSDIIAPHIGSLWLSSKFFLIHEQKKDPIPWEQKKNTLFWRGGNTGGYAPNYSIATRFPRMKFVKSAEIAQKYTKVKLDVAFSNCNYWSFCDEVKQNYRFSDYFDQNLQNQFKYIAVLDGDTYAGRMQLQLCFNSLIFYNSAWLQWFSQMIKPGIHYVEFKYDYSDFLKKLNYYNKNDKKAKEIAKRGSDFAINRFQFKDVRCYWALLLVEYGEIFAEMKPRKHNTFDREL